jgi:WG containing repeat
MQGLIDIHGSVVLPFEYDSLSPPARGVMCCCRKPGKYGYIDLSGKVVIPASYDYAVPFDPVSGTTWTLSRDGGKEKYTLIDVTGRPINKIPYDTVACPREGRIRFFQGDRKGYLDENGEVVIPPQFADATDFSYNLAAVQLRPSDEIYYYIDPQGKFKLGPYKGTVAFWCEFNDGLALLQDSNEPTRYINPNGEVLIELPKDIKGDPFSDGFAVVWDREKDLCGYIDPRGKYFIPPSLTNARFFHSGYALITAGKEKFYSDTSGNRVRCPAGYRVTDVSPTCSRMCVVDQKGKWGVADMNGNLVVPPIYKTIHQFSENHAVAVLA